MNKINSDEFLRFLKKTGKRNFWTLHQKKEFIAELTSSGILYIPKIRKKLRKHTFEYLNLIIKRFNETESFRPIDYKDLPVRNASYTLTLISEFIKKGRKISQGTKFFDFEKRSAMEGYQSDRKYLLSVRNRPIVEERKRLDGFRCQACRFKLKVNKKFIIECHHKIPFCGGKRRITNIEELVCLCPTCHRIAHIRKPPYSVKEIKSILKKI